MGTCTCNILFIEYHLKWYVCGHERTTFGKRPHSLSYSDDFILKEILQSELCEEKKYT